MKITTHAVRTLLALLFLFASIAYFFKLMPQEVPPASVQDYMKGIMSVNLLNIVKGIELVCGFLLLINLFAPLANVVLFPISINILILNATLMPDQPAKVIMAVVLVLVHLFLAFAYRKNYEGVLSTKPW